MTWRELIASIYEGREERPGIACRPKFCPAATEAELAEAEAHLGDRLPDSIRSLLRETNGVLEMMSLDGGDWFESRWLLWPIAEMVEQNRFYRAPAEEGNYSRDFRSLAFFADAGCDGILFGFPVPEDGICSPSVVVWYPIEDELREVAPSLDEFLRGWMTGGITI